MSEAKIRDLYENVGVQISAGQVSNLLIKGQEPFHAEGDLPIVRLLLCDDAPPFNWIAQELALCWVHEGRHYKKLMPSFVRHFRLLKDFREQFWGFYDELLTYYGQEVGYQLLNGQSHNK